MSIETTILISKKIKLKFKGTINDSLGLKNIQNLSEIKKMPVNHNIYHFVLKKSLKGSQLGAFCP